MKLSDICEFIVDCPHTTAPDEGKGFPLIRTPNIGKGRLILDGVHRVSENVYLQRNTRATPENDDLIFAREATAGNVAIIKNEEKVCLGQRTVLIRPNKLIVNPDYLTYYLLAPQQQYNLLGMANGATVAHVNLPVIRNLQISLPLLETQRKIADILSAYDDLIENNQKQIKLLEEAAQRLYKEWFVDLHFPEYENTKIADGIPEGWRRDVLGNCMSVKRGGSPRPIQEFLSDKGLNWLKISDATSANGYYILDIKEHIIEAGLNKTVFLKKGSLVLSNSATPGIPKILDVDSCIHDGWLYFSDSCFTNEFLFLMFLEEREKLITLGTGAVFTNLKTDIVKNYSVTVPAKEILNKFQDRIKPVFLAIQNKQNAIKKLAEARDRLLPKLMSGEIEV